MRNRRLAILDKPADRELLATLPVPHIDNPILVDDITGEHADLLRTDDGVVTEPALLEGDELGGGEKVDRTADFVHGNALAVDCETCGW